jgi:hypothetical protein
VQVAGTLRAPSDTEQTITQKAGSSGLTVQVAVIDKPAVERSTVQQFRTAKIELTRAAMRKLKSAWPGSSW